MTAPLNAQGLGRLPRASQKQVCEGSPLTHLISQELLTATLAFELQPEFGPHQIAGPSSPALNAFQAQAYPVCETSEPTNADAQGKLLSCCTRPSIFT